MAGDWIKMECSTPEKPEVMAITSRLGLADTDMTVGKLFRLWRWFDQHTVDGNADGVTTALLDQMIGVSGFCDAVHKSNWLCVTDSGISLPKFDHHNGATAKSRAMTAKRVAKHKAGNGEGNARSVTNGVSEALPREEKRREEKNKDSTSNDVLVAEEPDDGPGACPQKVLIAAYHHILPELPPVNEWSVANAKAMRQRWRSNPDRSSVDWWKGFFEYVKASDFLTGRKTSFQASLGWIVKAENFAKILNGQYENRI